MISQIGLAAFASEAPCAWAYRRLTIPSRDGPGAIAKDTRKVGSMPRDLALVFQITDMMRTATGKYRGSNFT